MDLTVGEISMLLGMCVRGLKDQARKPRTKTAETDRLECIAACIEDVYSDLQVFTEDPQ